LRIILKNEKKRNIYIRRFQGYGWRWRGMMCEARKVVFTVSVSFLILTAFASVSEAKTIYVPDDYARIQWAVDSASIGDTIIVRDGTYYENVVVNKKLTIKSENGSAYCIVDGGGSTVFTLEADGIRIKEFSITGGSYGIYIRSNNNNIISNNTISSNNDGIYLMNSNNNIISNNLISSNNDYGIHLYESNMDYTFMNQTITAYLITLSQTTIMA